MNKRLMIGWGIFILVLIITSCIRNQPTGSSLVTDISPGSENSVSKETINPSTNTNNSLVQNVITSKVSAKDLVKHNVQSDCWVSYAGKVYDITSFLPNHPGSAAAIAPYCGTASEFEKAFVAQHGTKKVSRLMKVGVFMGDFDVIGELNNA